MQVCEYSRSYGLDPFDELGRLPEMFGDALGPGNKPLRQRRGGAMQWPRWF